MLRLRLFLAQFRGVWRTRARLNDLRLDIFRRRFALRSWAGAEAESSTAVLHIAQLTLLDLVFASALAFTIWRLSPLLHSSRFVVNDAAYVQLLATVAAIGGVFVGLYYAALTAAMSAVYAQMPNSVRQLLMQERYGNAYMRFVATVTLLSLILLLGQALGISTSSAGAPILTLLAGIAVFGFVKLGTWAFRLFDPTSISDTVFRDAYLLLKQLTVGGYQWRNAAFQDFARRRGAHILRTLDELASICESSSHLRDEALVRLAMATLGFAAHSIESRDRIPTNSAWFPQKYSQPEWYRTPDHETSIAHYTGTLLQPKSTRDHWGLESQCQQIAIRALHSFLSRKEDSHARSIVTAFESYVGTLANHGWTTESLAIVDQLEDILVNAVIESAGQDQMALLNRVALIDCIGRLRITCLLRGADWADSLDRKKLDQQVANADWTDARTPYSLGLYAYSLDQAEWLAGRISFEDLVRGESATPPWYVAEILSQQNAEAISRNVRGLFRDAYSRMRAVLDQIDSKPVLWEKACLLSDALHYTRKAQRHLVRFEGAWDRTSAGRLIPKLGWPTEDFNAMAEALDGECVEVIERMASLLPHLPTRPADLPDYPGQFLHTCTEQVFEFILAGNKDKLTKIFPSVFLGCLSKHDSLRPTEVNADSPWLDAELSLAFAPILDLVELSGYCYLLSEVYPERATWPVVRYAWETFLSRQPQFADILVTMIAYSKSLFAVTPRSILRTNWEQRVEHQLRQLPVKHAGGWGQREVIDHPSAFVRAVVMPGLITSMYDGADMFVATYLAPREGIQRNSIHAQASELTRSVARSSEEEMEDPGEEQQDA